jgi:hypothetical protein
MARANPLWGARGSTANSRSSASRSPRPRYGNRRNPDCAPHPVTESLRGTAHWLDPPPVPRPRSGMKTRPGQP